MELTKSELVVTKACVTVFQADTRRNWRTLQTFHNRAKRFEATP